MPGVFAHWKTVHTERLDRRTKLVIEQAGGEFVASIKGASWSAGTGKWFQTKAEAIADGRALFRKHQRQLAEFERREG